MHELLLCSSSAISQLGVEKRKKKKKRKGPLPYSPCPRCLNRKLPDASLSPKLCWVIEQMSWEGGGWEIEVEQIQKFHSVFHYKTWWEPGAGIMWWFFVRECGCRKDALRKNEHFTCKSSLSCRYPPHPSCSRTSALAREPGTSDNSGAGATTRTPPLPKDRVSAQKHVRLHSSTYCLNCCKKRARCS